MASASKVADGDIKPYRFVTLTTTDGRVVVCGAGTQIYGISHAGTHRTPLQGLDDGLAASAFRRFALRQYLCRRHKKVGAGPLRPLAVSLGKQKWPISCPDRHPCEHVM